MEIYTKNNIRRPANDHENAGSTNILQRPRRSLITCPSHSLIIAEVIAWKIRGGQLGMGWFGSGRCQQGLRMSRNSFALMSRSTNRGYVYQICLIATCLMSSGYLPTLNLQANLCCCWDDVNFEQSVPELVSFQSCKFLHISHTLAESH